MKNTSGIMVMILIAAALIELLAFSVLLYGFPGGMQPEAALYINAIFATFIMVASGTWLLTYWLEKRGVKTWGWVAGTEETQ
ncbi:MAG: hypothetical protein EAX95_00100 [Candidatus Thorarchaeota archaeon]|nr:hypothetical protein [Candidatus Thorarchaeota archaeon]